MVDSVATLTFRVSAKLLRELGERLVGKPSAALAELIKNSYDADAYHAAIEIDAAAKIQGTGKGRIVVEDSGHGMTKAEFEDFWMRIGQTHKENGVSKYLKRPYTGSKGIGRIAAMSLADKLSLETVSVRKPRKLLSASIDWRRALQYEDLVNVEVKIEERPAGRRPAGTRIVLEGLKADWTDEKNLMDLASEIWLLEPPFSKRGSINDVVDPGEVPPMAKRDAAEFRITLRGPPKEKLDIFESRMRAILELWTVKLTGLWRDGVGEISLQFKGERPVRYSYDVEGRRAISPHLNKAEFTILIFELQGKQPRGVKVTEARQYLQRFGGVQIYDSRFRLPYYGDPDNDWLRIAQDVSKRGSASGMLPEELRTPEGPQSLPQWYQVFGEVHVNTQREDDLKILATRDRLRDSLAFEDLREFVRFAIHWYANEKRERDLTRALRPAKNASAGVRALDKVIALHSESIPKPVQKALKKAIRQTKELVADEKERVSQQLAALSTYATAGIATMAYHHELSKQLLTLEDITHRLDADRLAQNPGEIARLREALETWAGRTRQIGAIFTHLLDRENLEAERKYRVKSVVEDVVSQLTPALEGVTVSTEDMGALLFPPATYAEWVSIMQNVVLNAVNALENSKRPKLVFSTESHKTQRRLIVQDNGRGIDLRRADEFFKPFVREGEISPQRQAAGYGGTGLGLAIVKMIADRRAASARFEEPASGYKTKFVLEWKE